MFLRQAKNDFVIHEPFLLFQSVVRFTIMEKLVQVLFKTMFEVSLRYQAAHLSQFRMSSIDSNPSSMQDVCPMNLVSWP